MGVGSFIIGGDSVDSSQSRRSSAASIFSKQLKGIMKSRCLTHKQVAEMAGVPVSTVNEWTSGRTPRNLEKVATLALRLGVSFSWLLIDRQEEVPLPTLTDLLEEVPCERLTGIYRIEAMRLVPRTKS